MKTECDVQLDHYDEPETGGPILRAATAPQTIYARFGGMIVNFDDVATSRILPGRTGRFSCPRFRMIPATN